MVELRGKKEGKNLEERNRTGHDLDQTTGRKSRAQPRGVVHRVCWPCSIPGTCMGTGTAFGLGEVPDGTQLHKLRRRDFWNYRE